jgi:hypothetical protein
MPVQPVFGRHAPAPRSLEDVQNGLMRQEQARMALEGNALGLEERRNELADRPAILARKDAEHAARLGEIGARTKASEAHAEEYRESAKLKKQQAYREQTIELARQFSAADPNDNAALVGIYQGAIQSQFLDRERAEAELKDSGEPGTPQRAAWHARQKQMAMTAVERQTKALQEARDAEVARHHAAQETEARRKNLAREVPRVAPRAAGGGQPAATPTGRVSPGWRWKADGSGDQEPIPGGPHDPARGSGKPLAPAVVKQIQEARDNAATIERASSTFKPEFASKGVLGMGADASMSAKGVLGLDKDSVAWWKDYRKQAELIERHALFGAALTPTEQASWRSADIHPGMDAAVIKTNLATRAALARKVAENTAADMKDAGHNAERIDAIAGRNAQPDAPKAAVPTFDADKEKRYQEWKARQGK